MELFNTYPFIDARLMARRMFPDAIVTYGTEKVTGGQALRVSLQSKHYAAELLYRDQDMKDTVYDDYMLDMEEACELLLSSITNRGENGPL